ncbi:hypothetical protein QYM36_005801 [Artemia franciscana]|uniref:Uncharacterized protein n=1 Tax=Artemia franciscana TaxID=6661 RepID=A0AA88LAU0_ARTSF|nr:hypothetical protein QYM36_005801 [Artemia franciscana]
MDFLYTCCFDAGTYELQSEDAQAISTLTKYSRIGNLKKYMRPIKKTRGKNDPPAVATITTASLSREILLKMLAIGFSIALVKRTRQSKDYLGYIRLQDIGRQLIQDEEIQITEDLIIKDALIHYVHEDGLELMKKFRTQRELNQNLKRSELKCSIQRKRPVGLCQEAKYLRKRYGDWSGYI